MTIVNADPTPFLKIPIPGPDSDPFYDQFVAYTLHIEQYLFMAQVMKNLLLAGGGTVSFNSGTSLLSWTDDFTVPVFHWGKKILVRYGSDGASRSINIANGQALVIDIPNVISANIVLNCRVVAQLNTNLSTEWVMGWRLDNKVYLRDLGEVS